MSLFRYPGGKANPCQPDCPRRTVTCKFDGTCDDYKKFSEQRMEKLNTMYGAKANEKTVDAVQWNGHRSRKKK